MKCIFKFLSNKKNEELNRLAAGIKKAFISVKSELDDHLETINQNTGEIQAGQGLVAELDSKIDKLSERIDEIELRLSPEKSSKLDARLTPREQEVFMVLYMSGSLSAREISRILGFTQDMVNMYILNLITKGVPVRREMIDDLLVFSLEPEFKNMQARRNVLEIDPVIAQQVSLRK